MQEPVGAAFALQMQGPVGVAFALRVQEAVAAAFAPQVQEPAGGVPKIRILASPRSARTNLEVRR